jgi:hypothetical protein
MNIACDKRRNEKKEFFIREKTFTRSLLIAPRQSTCAKANIQHVARLTDKMRHDLTGYIPLIARESQRRKLVGELLVSLEVFTNVY